MKRIIKKTIPKKPPVIKEEESIARYEKDRFMWIRLPDAINVRFVAQCKRLTCGATTMARMAIVKFIEEEEAKQKALKEMKINL